VNRGECSERAKEGYKGLRKNMLTVDDREHDILAKLNKLKARVTQRARNLAFSYGLGASGIIGIPLLGFGASGTIGIPLLGFGASGTIGIPLLGFGASGIIGMPLA
jgi:hypothetical protein